MAVVVVEVVVGEELVVDRDGELSGEMVIAGSCVCQVGRCSRVGGVGGVGAERFEEFGDAGVGESPVSMPTLSFDGDDVGVEELGEVFAGRGRGDSDVSRELTTGVGSSVHECAQDFGA